MRRRLGGDEEGEEVLQPGEPREFITTVVCVVVSGVVNKVRLGVFVVVDKGWASTSTMKLNPVFCFPWLCLFRLGIRRAG